MHDPTHPASSKRRILQRFYTTINNVARPGDVVFFISERRTTIHSPLTRLYRRWQGLADQDNSMWHTAILVEPKKESRGAQMRPHIIHATKKGVEEIHIPPSFFKSIRDDPDGEPVQKSRIEIIQCSELSALQRRQIIGYACAQLGKPFAELGWRHDILTYAFGLPSRRLHPNRVSCHGLAFLAYQVAGFGFPHQLKHAPFFNLAGVLGHPLGHPSDEVDLRRLYLRDHHLYRDPRFKDILRIFEDEQTGQITLLHNPEKTPTDFGQGIRDKPWVLSPVRSTGLCKWPHRAGRADRCSTRHGSGCGSCCRRSGGSGQRGAKARPGQSCRNRRRWHSVHPG